MLMYDNLSSIEEGKTWILAKVTANVYVHLIAYLGLVN
jgi:hypothetical protein